MKDENRFCLVTLRTIKENIMIGRKPTYNPVCVLGSSKEERFKMISGVLNK